MKRKTAVIVLILVYILGVATPYITYFGFGLLGRFWGSDREFSRVTSPDGVLDAVVLQDNPGAFSSFIYYLYLVPKGGEAGTFNGDPAIVNTSEGDALRVNWENPHFLNVDTGNSHVKFFGNLWYSKKVNDYYVQLTLTPSGRNYLQPNGKLRGDSPP
jgi:hypothetical protein